jgi:pimeloyl-ACP methyl ester carboxylesterase
MAPTNIFVPGAPSIGRNRRRVSYGLGGAAIPDPAIASLLAKVQNFWTLDEASGNRADSIGGIALPPTGTPGNAAAINGNGLLPTTGNFLSVPSTAALQTGNISFTVACRFKPSGVGLNQTIVAKGNNTALATMEWGLCLLTTGQLDFDVWQSSAAQSLNATNFGVIQAGKWHDIIAWVDTTANTMNIEVNGVLTSVTKAKTPVANTGPLTVGAYANGNQIAGSAVIDDLTFSKSVWTAAERKAWRRKTYPFNVGQGIFDTGQLYNEWAASVSGTNMDILIPSKVDLSGTLVLYCHGSGELANVWVTDSLKAGVRDTLMGDGHIIAASLAGGNLWGNDTANTHYVNLVNQVTSRFNVTRIVAIFQSMGGTSGFKIVADNLIPNIKGVYCIYPVCNLANLYGNASFTSAIQSAYGIPGSGTYATQTAGHDPVLFTTTQLQNFTMPMRFTASYGDTVVPRPQNTDQFQPLISPYAKESGIITTTGDHGDASNFIPSDVKAFIDRCF